MENETTPCRETPEGSLAGLQAAAERGDPAAMHDLGLFFSQGEGGLPQDYAAALRWLDKAAKKIFPRAYYLLGIHHFNGLGVPLSRKNGVRWYFKAARVGVPEAMFQMGLCLQKGIEYQPDLDKALFWFRKASEAGLADADYKLGTLHSQGIHTKSTRPARSPIGNAPHLPAIRVRSSTSACASSTAKAVRLSNRVRPLSCRWQRQRTIFIRHGRGNRSSSLRGQALLPKDGRCGLCRGCRRGNHDRIDGRAAGFVVCHLYCVAQGETNGMRKFEAGLEKPLEKASMFYRVIVR